jgi:hypothetical protein
MAVSWARGSCVDVEVEVAQCRRGWRRKQSCRRCRPMSCAKALVERVRLGRVVNRQSRPREDPGGRAQQPESTQERRDCVREVC